MKNWDGLLIFLLSMKSRTVPWWLRTLHPPCKDSGKSMDKDSVPIMAPKAICGLALVYLSEIIYLLIIQGNTLNPFTWKYLGCESVVRIQERNDEGFNHQWSSDWREWIDSRGVQETELTEHGDKEVRARVVTPGFLTWPISKSGNIGTSLKEN